VNYEELSRKARDLTPYGVIPPFMRIKTFLEFLWPLSRTSLFAALRQKKFHSFILRDGLSSGGIRLIDTADAVSYLASLSEAAKEKTPALEHRKAPPKKRKRLQPEAALTS